MAVKHAHTTEDKDMDTIVPQLLGLLAEMRQSADPADALRRKVREVRKSGVDDDLRARCDSTPRSTEVRGLVESTLAVEAGDNPVEAEFYRRIWEFIEGNASLHDDFDHACALAATLSSLRMPYRWLDLVTMDNNDFTARCERMGTSLDAMEAISRRTFTQYTQEASAYLDLIEDQDDRLDRVTLMAVLLHAFRPGGNEQQ